MHGVVGKSIGLWLHTVTTETYITIHDQDLVLNAETTGQFDDLSHTYLFVGYGPVDKIRDEVNVIVCRDHEPNYEHWPQFYDFTGWWVLADHGLLDGVDNMICLQYDMRVLMPDLEARVEAMLTEPDGMIAFNAGYYGPNWMLMIQGFEQAYRAGLARVGVNPDDFHPFNEWPCTQGTAWRAKTMIDYMHWFEPMFEAFHTNIWAGHLSERTVKAYLAANGVAEQYLLGAVWHAAADMHGTGALMGGNLALYQERNAKFMRQGR